MENNEKKLKLEDFPLKKQQTLDTCGYAVLGMILSFLGQPTEEKGLSKFFPAIFGTPPAIFSGLFNRRAKNFFIERQQVKNQAELEKLLARQLAAGYPVPVIYYTIFPGNKKLLHYGVVTEIKDNKITIVDPSPFMPEKIELTSGELFNAIALNDKVRINGWGPFRDKMALGLGVVKRNGVFVIVPRKS